MRNTAKCILLLLMLATAVVSLTLLRARAQRVKQALPIVVTMAPPTYPIVARLAHVEGIVRLNVTTDGRQVTDVQAQDNAPRLLVTLAEKNVRSWQFEPGDPATFTATYAYKLVTYSIPGADSTSITLKLPLDVAITAAVPVNGDLPPDKR